MSEASSLPERLAKLLEELASTGSQVPDWLAAPAYVVGNTGVRPIERIDAPTLDLLRGIDRQKTLVTANVKRHAAGHAAHDMLLWGARGMGKSALLRAAVMAVQADGRDELALVQVESDALHCLPALVAQLGKIDRRFLLYCDDLGFAEDASAEARLLRSWLEGGIEPRPANVRLAVTSNRRAIVPRHMSEQDDPINPRDAVDDQLALADRFGLAIGFHNCSQEEYLAIISGYCEKYGLVWEEADALLWAKQRGSRSGRVAWHYVTELAGRADKAL